METIISEINSSMSVDSIKRLLENLVLQTRGKGENVEQLNTMLGQVHKILKTR